MNCIELPWFDRGKKQKKTLSIDINSLFPHAMLQKQPVSRYMLHEEGSALIVAMRKVLQEQGPVGFCEHYKTYVALTNTYFLLTVKIEYPSHLHAFFDLVPSFRKRAVGVQELSDAQLWIMKKMGLKPSFRDPILVSDLHPQTITISFSYLCLLCSLGVILCDVSRAMSAFSAPILRDAVGDLLHLKKTAKNDFFRQLSKNCLNSSYGRMSLQSHSYPDLAVARGRRQITRAMSSSHLLRFKILAPEIVLTYNQKRMVKCDSLFFIGCSIQNASKLYVLETYYTIIKARLTRSFIDVSLSLSCVYCDTDNLVIECHAASFNECGRLIRTSDILYEIRDLIDFENYLKHFPSHRIFEELRSRLSEDEFTSLVAEMRRSVGQSGLYKTEHHLGKYSGEITYFYSLRIKCYLLRSFMQDSADEAADQSSFKEKRCLKGSILRSRAKNLAEKDYLQMSDDSDRYLERNMTKIISKHWQYFMIKIKRYRPHTFDRKRSLVSQESGLSVPFGYQPPN